MELAYQLKIDVQKKEKEIIKLDDKVQNLERAKEEKVGCISTCLAIGNQPVYEKVIFMYRNKSAMNYRND